MIRAQTETITAMKVNLLQPREKYIECSHSEYKIFHRILEKDLVSGAMRSERCGSGNVEYGALIGNFIL